MTINIPNSTKKRIAIVGGGFAGLTLARRLAKSRHYQIVLIDKNNYHQFQPLFYQVAMAGLEPSSIVFPLRKIFQKKEDVFIRVATVERVDATQKIVHTTAGTLTYDYLVLAMGADTNFFGNEQIAKHVIPMKSVSEALYLRNAILGDYEKALTTADFDARQKLIDIAIVGGGPTGVEVAGALAEMKTYILPKDYPELDSSEVDIYLIQGADTLLQGMSAEASEAALRFLKDLGVKVLLNRRVTDIDEEGVYMDNGEHIPARKVIWAAGITGNKVEGIPADAMTRGRRILVNEYLQIQGQEDIFVLGDVALCQTKDTPNGHPQVAQVAIQQGKLMADNFNRMAKEKPLKSFAYKDKGSMATIGRHLAVVDLPRYKMQGAFAWFIWLAVHLFSLIGTKNKLFVFVNWLWNYMTYDQALRLIIKPTVRPPQE